MKANELKRIIKDGALDAYKHLYADTATTAERFIKAIDEFTAAFGEEREIYILSAPGRSEILGNHTDHNRGCVLAGAIDRDIIAVAAKNDDGVIRLRSEGYGLDTVEIAKTDDPKNFKDFSSSALIAGLVRGFINDGFSVGGFDAYTTSDVLKGSGISSSAAYEVMIGNILNHLYNGGAVKNQRVAELSQYAENVFFGKPCGLMDQMACAVGGFVYMDFEDPNAALITPIDFSLSAAGYTLCIVNTGGNHADLNEDYASVPLEMKKVAAILGGEVLRGYAEADMINAIPKIREEAGDRAVLRALHFVRENERVLRARDALIGGKLDSFFDTVKASGNSSFKYLQNVYTTKNVSEQGLSLALALTDGFLSDGEGAFRVHGGGFAGTIQAYIRRERVAEYEALMNSVFGEGAVMKLNIRPEGAVRLF